MVRWPSGKARVCKTLIRGFDSHPHLFLQNRNRQKRFLFCKNGARNNTNCLVLRRESKGADISEFERKRKARMASRGRERRTSVRRLVADLHPHLFFLPKKAYFVVALCVGYLRATARVPPVFLLRSRLELSFFRLKEPLRTVYFASSLRELKRFPLKKF